MATARGMATARDRHYYTRSARARHASRSGYGSAPAMQQQDAYPAHPGERPVVAHGAQMVGRGPFHDALDEPQHRGNQTRGRCVVACDQGGVSANGGPVNRAPTEVDALDRPSQPRCVTFPWLQKIDAHPAV
jgi:hypothetical protein